MEVGFNSFAASICRHAVDQTTMSAAERTACIHTANVICIKFLLTYLLTYLLIVVGYRIAMVPSRSSESSQSGDERRHQSVSRRHFYG